MKCQTENRVYIPEFALRYLIDCDSTSIQADEIATIDNWLNGYLKKFGQVLNYVISLNSETADLFSIPAFGSAAGFDCSITVFYK